MRYCAVCGRALDLHARADARYCSTACRMVAYRRRQQGGTVSTALLDRLVDEAGPVSEVALLRGIEAAARESWEAAAFILERRYPERWTRAPDRATREPDLLA
jgi:predicted nucleic acid-binding Zn ribbon protein